MMLLRPATLNMYTHATTLPRMPNKRQVAALSLWTVANGVLGCPCDFLTNEHNKQNADTIQSSITNAGSN